MLLGLSCCHDNFVFKKTKDAPDIRPDNPAFFDIRPDNRLLCQISGKAG
jgi:hypothetical protein